MCEEAVFADPPIGSMPNCPLGGQPHAGLVDEPAVAFQLGISEETAKSYLKRIREKYRVAGIDVGTKVALRRRAIQDGILISTDAPNSF